MSETSQQTTIVKEETLPQPKTQTTPASLVDIINIIADRVDPVVKIITTVAERSLKANQAEARFRVHMAWIAVLIVAMIVGIAGTLTYIGKLDGSTFGFLLGLIVGYILTFIRDSIKPPTKE